MYTPYNQIFENNKKWVAEKLSLDSNFFNELNAGQDPNYLYIGCSDSRVTAEEIMGVAPGEVFVHRNIANMVNNIDLNVMSVINYAVKHLQVKDIIVCGHYGCGGVKASMEAKDLGILNPWLRCIRDVFRMHKDELFGIHDEKDRFNKLVELNVREQVINIVKTSAVQESYLNKGYPIVHGWVFDMSTGLIKDLNIDFNKKLRLIAEVYNLGLDKI
jgi:carbonic anhydrase